MEMNSENHHHETRPILPNPTQLQHLSCIINMNWKNQGKNHNMVAISPSTLLTLEKYNFATQHSSDTDTKLSKALRKFINNWYNKMSKCQRII
jgi:hypothetical protein